MTTDYKQCLLFVEQLRADAPALVAPGLVDQDPERAHNLLVLNRDTRGAPLREKTERLLLRAREKDPDKQMYSDNMCAKIEVLAVAAAEAAAPFDEAADAIEAAYAAYLRRLAATAAWEEELQTGLGAVEKREGQARTLLLLDAKLAMAKLGQQRQASDRVAMGVKRGREEAAWGLEVARREKERLFAAALAGAPAAATIDAAIAQLEARHEGTARPVVRRIVELLGVLSMHPEEAAVRSLRCNNRNVMAHFGHPCAAPAATSTQAVPAPGAARWAFTEAVLGLIGYAPRYTDVPVLPPEPAWLGDGPCSIDVAPWDDHGERLLGLREPDAFVEPDLWMEWHERMQAVAAHLERRGRSLPSAGMSR